MICRGEGAAPTKRLTSGSRQWRISLLWAQPSPFPIDGPPSAVGRHSQCFFNHNQSAGNRPLIMLISASDMQMSVC